MFFWNSLAFSMIQRMLVIWSLVPLPFLKPAWTSGSSQFTYCWSLASENFEHYFTIVWDECNYAVVWAFFGIAFLWDWNENWPFPVLWPLLSFPNLLACWVRNAVLGCNLKNDRMISVRFQGKSFNITVIQVYALTSNAEKAEVEWFYEDLKELLEVTPQKDVLFIIGDWNARRKSRDSWTNKQASLLLEYKMKQGKW